MKNNITIDELLSRGVENIYPSAQEFEKVLKTKKITIYHGIDPTADTLHLGHMVQFLKLKGFQDLGHKVIILIGDFTAQIGDPTDKSSARQPLTHRQVLQNARYYKKQISRFLDLKKIHIKYNSKWLGKLSFADTLALASNFTAQQTLSRDMFKKRTEEGKDLYLHEFLYPLMQAYDSVAMDVDAEMGGNDQMFNMLAGRTLMKKLKQKEKFVLTTKLLVDPQGVKMGKTQGNMAKLNDTPDDMFGKIMSMPDGFILPAFELLTEVPMAEIEKYKTEMQSGRNPIEIKMIAAFHIVELNFGKKAAHNAQESFISVHQNKEIPQEMMEVHAASKNILDVLLQAKLALSKSEAKRIISQKGVKVDGKIVESEDFKITKNCVIQRGKRLFVKIII